MSRLSNVYTLKMKSGADWREIRTVRLLISVGSPQHVGEKFAATVDWINRNSDAIDNVIISVNDDLQRHNFAANENHVEATIQARMLGQEWMAAHAEAIRQIKPKVEIVRWKDYMSEPEYRAFKAEIDIAYAEVPEFRNAVHADAKAFLGRQERKHMIAYTGEAKASLLVAGQAYILEELAVFAMLVKNKPAAEVYPGSNLLSADYWVNNQPPQCPRINETLGHRRYFRCDFSKLHTVEA